MPKLSDWNSYQGNSYLRTRKVLVRGLGEDGGETFVHAIIGL